MPKTKFFVERRSPWWNIWNKEYWVWSHGFLPTVNETFYPSVLRAMYRGTDAKQRAHIKCNELEQNYRRAKRP